MYSPEKLKKRPLVSMIMIRQKNSNDLYLQKNLRKKKNHWYQKLNLALQKMTNYHHL